MEAGQQDAEQRPAANLLVLHFSSFVDVENIGKSRYQGITISFADPKAWRVCVTGRR